MYFFTEHLTSTNNAYETIFIAINKSAIVTGFCKLKLGQWRPSGEAAPTSRVMALTKAAPFCHLDRSERCHIITHMPRPSLQKQSNIQLQPFKTF